MAVKKKYTESLPVQIEPAWRERIRAVADHPDVEVSQAEVVRDCIKAALPNFELSLGILNLDDITEEDLDKIGISRAREPEEPAPPVKEDRAKGSFGWTPPQG